MIQLFHVMCAIARDDGEPLRQHRAERSLAWHKPCSLREEIQKREEGEALSWGTTTSLRQMNEINAENLKLREERNRP